MPDINITTSPYLGSGKRNSLLLVSISNAKTLAFTVGIASFSY